MYIETACGSQIASLATRTHLNVFSAYRLKLKVYAGRTVRAFVIPFRIVPSGNGRKPGELRYSFGCTSLCMCIHWLRCVQCQTEVTGVVSLAPRPRNTCIRIEYTYTHVSKRTIVVFGPERDGKPEQNDIQRRRLQAREVFRLKFGCNCNCYSFRQFSTAHRVVVITSGVVGLARLANVKLNAAKSNATRQ